MGGYLLSHCNGTHHTKCNIFSLAEEFAVVITIVLPRTKVRGAEQDNSRQSHVDKSGRPQEEMVLLHLLGVNDTEIAADIDILNIRALEFLVFLL